MSEPTDRIVLEDNSCSPRSLPVYVRTQQELTAQEAKVGEIDNEEVNSPNKDRAYGTFVRNGNLVNTDSHQSFRRPAS